MNRKNVILITVDALRAGHLSCLGYFKKTTPNLDNLAHKGVLFSQAISNGSSTPFSFPPIMTSTYALMHTPSLALGGGIRLSKWSVTIAEVLKKEGYHTAAFACMHPNPYLSSYYNYNRGFDTFEELPETSLLKTRIDKLARRMSNKLCEVSGKACWLRACIRVHFRKKPSNKNSDRINQRAIHWLEDCPDDGNPFFIWLHYMNPHEPYTPPIKYLKQVYSKSVSRLEMFKLWYKMKHNPKSVSEDELVEMINLYDGEIRWVDHIIGSFFKKLREIGVRFDETFSIITADHGEEFRDHGGFGHSSRFRPDIHEITLYDELLRVPIIINGPGIKNRIVKDQVVLLDLGPTILDLLNIKAPKSFQGMSLLPIIKGERGIKSRGAISEAAGKVNVDDKEPLRLVRRTFSYRTEKWKYILVLDGENRRRELYDLQNDPRETKNLAEKEIERTKKFELRILNHISREKEMLKEEEEEAEYAYSPGEKEKIKERLTRLGYL